MNPNAYFNEAEYLIAKTNQVNSVKQDGRDNWTVEEVKAAIAGLSMSVAEHYETFGGHETDAKGNLINPSNAFDANAYVVAKLAELVKTEPEKWAGKTASDVIAAIAENGMSPVTHYEMHGATEANAYGVPLVQTVPVAQRVENDPARAEVTGENVPSNYNAPTPPPAEVTADKAAPVTKPADVGGLTNATVSPEVTVPSEPIPVPGDADYVAPPANIVDTNDKPVVVVPPAKPGDKPQFGVVGDNGTINGVDSNGKPTDTIIGNVDNSGTIKPTDPTPEPTPNPTPNPEPVDPTPPPAVDTTAPTFTGASINTEGKIVLSFSEKLDTTSYDSASFTVSGTSPTAGSVSGNTVTLDKIDTNKAVTLTYTPSTTKPIQDVAGNDAKGFTIGLVKGGTEAATGKFEMGTVSDIYLDGVQGKLPSLQEIVAASASGKLPSFSAKIPVVTSETEGDLIVHLKNVGSTLEGLPVANPGAGETVYTTTIFTPADSPRDFFNQNLTANLAGHLYTNAKPIKIEATKADSYNLVAEKGQLNMVDVGAGSAASEPDEATALNISGEGKVLVNVDVKTLTTIDASDNTGGVYVNTKSMSPLANAQTGELTSVKGGTGNDMFIMDMDQIGKVTDEGEATSARTFTLDANVAGGAGDDLLALSVKLDSSDHLELNKDSFAGKLSSFEHIMLDKVGTSQSFEIDAEGFKDLGVEELILQSSANIKNVDGLGNNGTKPNISVLCPKTGKDGLHLNVSASKANQTLDLDVIMTNAGTGMGGNPAGFLKLKTYDVKDTDGTITNHHVSTINLTGHDDNAVVKFDNSSGESMTINAAEYLGILDYTVSGKGDTITLGDGVDTIRYTKNIYNKSNFDDKELTEFTKYDTINGDCDTLYIDGSAILTVNLIQNGSFTSVADVLTSLSDQSNAFASDKNDMLAFIEMVDDYDNTTSTGIYAVLDRNNNKVVEAGEVTLLGIVNGDITSIEGWATE